MRRSAKRRPHTPVFSEAVIAQGCGGKRVFESFAAASKAATNTRRQHEDSRVDAYKCRHCPAYHVGELEQSKKVKRPKLEEVT